MPEFSQSTGCDTRVWLQENTRFSAIHISGILSLDLIVGLSSNYIVIAINMPCSVSILVTESATHGRRGVCMRSYTF